MDHAKNLELDILITVRQNNKVPCLSFHQFFEQKWKLYCSRFNGLVTEGLIQIATSVPGIPVYELTGKGSIRITELLEQRENDIATRVVSVKQKRQATKVKWKSLLALLNSVIRFSAPSEEITHAEPLSDYQKT